MTGPLKTPVTGPLGIPGRDRSRILARGADRLGVAVYPSRPYYTGVTRILYYSTIIDW